MLATFSSYFWTCFIAISPINLKPSSETALTYSIRSFTSALSNIGFILLSACSVSLLIVVRGLCSTSTNMVSLIADFVVDCASSDTGIETTGDSPNGLILPRIPFAVNPDVFIAIPDFLAL